MGAAFLRTLYVCASSEINVEKEIDYQIAISVDMELTQTHINSSFFL